MYMYIWPHCGDDDDRTLCSLSSFCVHSNTPTRWVTDANAKYNYITSHTTSHATNRIATTNVGANADTSTNNTSSTTGTNTNTHT